MRWSWLDSQRAKPFHDLPEQRGENERARPIDPPGHASGEGKDDDFLIAGHATENGFRGLSRGDRPAQGKLSQMIFLPHVPVHIMFAHAGSDQARTGDAHLHAQPGGFLPDRGREADDSPFAGAKQ